MKFKITTDLYNLLTNPDKNDEADPNSSTISKTSAGRVVLLFSSVGKPDETLAFVFEMTSPKKQYKSTRYKNKWAVGIFEDWQRVRSVKFPIVEVGGVFKEYELHKVQPLTRPITEITGRIDAQLLVIQICSRGGKVFQRSIPSENVVPDCLQYSPIFRGKGPSHRVQSLF